MILDTDFLSGTLYVHLDNSFAVTSVAAEPLISFNLQALESKLSITSKLPDALTTDNENTLYESLILAQDERWRRA